MLAACGAGADPTTTTVTMGSVGTTTPTTVGAIATLADVTTTTTEGVGETTPTGSNSLDGALIVLDPGHNGLNWAHPGEINEVVDIGTGTKACNTTGTTTADGYPEAEFTWELAGSTRDRLEDLGATVILTRGDNEGWGPCITERAAIGNRAHADAVVSIHADGGPSDGRGFHVIYPKVIPGLTDDIADESARLATAIHDAFLETEMPVADYVGKDGYTVRDDLGGLTLSDVPVVFLEAGNMRNTVDAGLLAGSTSREEMAKAIVAGLIEFLSR